MALAIPPLGYPAATQRKLFRKVGIRSPKCCPRRFGTLCRSMALPRRNELPALVREDEAPAEPTNFNITIFMRVERTRRLGKEPSPPQTHEAPWASDMAATAA